MNELKPISHRQTQTYPLVVEELSPIERKDVHQLSQEAFEDLAKESLLYQGASYSQLEEEIDNPSIVKVLLKESVDSYSPTVGYLGIHTTIDTLTWMDAAKMEKIFGDAIQSNTFAYCSTVEISKNARSLRNSMALLSEGLDYVHKRAQAIGRHASMGFDCCRINNPAIPVLMQKTANKTGFGYQVYTIGRHDWLRISCSLVQSQEIENKYINNGDYIDLSKGHDTFNVQVVDQENLHGFSTHAVSRLGAFAYISGIDRILTEKSGPSKSQVSLIAGHILEFGSVFLDVDATQSEKIVQFCSILQEKVRQPLTLELADYQLYSGIIKG